MTKLCKTLFPMQDIKYKDFSSKLMPTVSPDTVIGIRTPVLRAFAKEFSKEKEAGIFLSSLPHRYYEENNLHAFILSEIKDFDLALSETEKFLPYIDNWATCDSFMPKIFRKNPDKLMPKIKKWLTSEHTYTVRFAIGLLMKLFLDKDFNEEYPELVSNVKSDEYYVNMMIAWYFATALAKQYDKVIGYIENNALDTWIHNKTIQKSVESHCISPEKKAYLKTLKKK